MSSSSSSSASPAAHFHDQLHWDVFAIEGQHHHLHHSNNNNKAKTKSPKKSLVDRIGQTFDKLALPRSSQPNYHQQQQQQQQIAFWPPIYAYPQHQCGRRTAAAHSHQQFQQIYPWEQQYVAQQQQQHVTYEKLSPQKKSPSRKSSICSCGGEDYFYGSVRGLSGLRHKKCVKCVNGASAVTITEFSPQKDPYDFMRESRISNKGDQKLYIAEDEWQKLWDNSDNNKNNNSEEENTSSSRCSTPSPPPLEKVHHRPASILEPQLTAYDLNEETETEAEGGKLEIIEADKRNVDVEEEEEEEKVAPVSKRRRNSPPFLIEEAIPEESEQDLLDNNIQIIISSPIQLRSILKKDRNNNKDQAKKGVKFSIRDEDNKNMEEDETLFGDYDKVIVSANLAEEILNEIYGKIEENNSTLVDDSSSSVVTVDNDDDVVEVQVENKEEKEAEEENNNKSMADEILDELYGTNVNKVTKDDSALIKNRQHEKTCCKDFAHLEALDLAVDVQEIQQRRKNRLRFLSRVFRDSFRLKHLPEDKILLLRQGGSDKFRLVHIKKPKEPPPPPPPIAQVLKPIVPPKPGLKSAQTASEEEEEDEEYSEFSSDEFDSCVDIKSDGEDDEQEADVEDDESGISSEDSSPDSNKSANNNDTSDNSVLTDDNIEVHRNVIVLKNTPVIDIDEQNRHRILISSSSWIKVETPTEQQQQQQQQAEEEGEKNRVKPPPRLKKLAKLKKLQVLHEEEENNIIMRKIYHQPKRPEISSPVLLATTFNPNDAEAHKSIQTTSLSSSSSSSSISISGGRRQDSSPSSKIKFGGLGDKIQRLSSFLPSLSSLSSLSGKEMTGRSSFYVAEAVYEEAMAEEEEEEDSSQLSSSPDHIYEEIPEKRLLENRPLPPIPQQQQQQRGGQHQQQEQKRKGSIFEGASKYEILHYLRDAKNRFGYSDFEIDLNGIEKSSSAGEERPFRRIGSCSSSSSASSSSSCEFFPAAKVKKSFSSNNIVERADSGVGSETSYNSNSASAHQLLLARSKTAADFERKCADCRQWLESDSRRLCKLCEKRRIERKEIVTEIYETELKYGRDLRIIVEEFYRPMLVAGLLTSDQLAAIFLNAEELIRANALFSSLLGDSINAAVETGDPDLVSVRAGKIFLDAMFMLRAYESYCTRQASASALLTSLEKEKELLKIFLKVSQMENCTLRRMNLGSFLMVPVQRVTKYPLLLSRLYKATAPRHPDRESVKHAKARIEAALDRMNKDAKDVNSNRLWKRLPIISYSASSTSSSLASSSYSPAAAANSANNNNNNYFTVKKHEMPTEDVQKLASEILGWKLEETRLPLEGRIQFAQPGEANWKRPWTGKMSPVHASLVVQSSQALPEVVPSAKECPIFPGETDTIKDAHLLLFKDKENTNKASMVKEPLPLERCIICCEPEWEDFFEIQDFVNKESFIFRGEDAEHARAWFQTMQFYTQSLGGWRRRRKGLANIMIDSPTIASAAEAGGACGGMPEETGEESKS